ncbi:MAG: methylmalonyl-CoA mutase family protein, partial [Novibacillus thermophilus]
LHANASDEALALPTEASVRTALRTQQIIAYESGAADTVDPLAGSYFVEELTDQLEQRVQDYLDEIEGQGGAVAAIERGFVQETIQSGAYRHQQKVERGEEVVVGVNRFVGEENREIVLHQSDPRLEQRQKRFLQQLRRSRDNVRLRHVLSQLQLAASGNENVMPFIIDAVKSGATVGEICDTLRETYGEYDSS